MVYGSLGLLTIIACLDLYNYKNSKRECTLFLRIESYSLFEESQHNF